jgi:hypothetical protein
MVLEFGIGRSDLGLWKRFAGLVNVDVNCILRHQRSIEIRLTLPALFEL